MGRCVGNPWESLPVERCVGDPLWESSRTSPWGGGLSPLPQAFFPCRKCVFINSLSDLKRYVYLLAYGTYPGRNFLEFAADIAQHHRIRAGKRPGICGPLRDSQPIRGDGWGLEARVLKKTPCAKT